MAVDGTREILERKKVRRSAACCWWATSGALLAIAGLVGLLLRTEPGLLDNARRAADASPWVPIFGGYYWESPRTILTFRPSGKSVRAVTVDVDTGAETDRVALSEDLAKGDISDLPFWRLSPDGRYLAWLTGDPRNPEWVVSTVNGSRYRTWPSRGDASPPSWLAGSKGFLNSRFDSIPVSGARTAFQSKSAIRYLDGPADAAVQVTERPFSWVIGISPEDTLVDLQPVFMGQTSPPRFEWGTFSLAPKMKQVDRKSVQLSSTVTGLLEAELSPDGKRFACLVHSEYLSPLEVWMNRILPGRFEPHEKVGLWTVRCDGNGMRMIGSEEGAAPFGLLWDPTGARLSFVDHGALYIVPAGR